MNRISLLRPALASSAAAIFVLTACAGPQAEDVSPAPAEAASASPATLNGDPAAFAVTSDDIDATGEFSNSVLGTSSPSCAGDSESLHLAWTEPPAGTQSIALLFENTYVDFVYWARADLEPAETVIEHDHYGAVSGRELTNDLALKYPASPCPEAGVTETYIITVWALDTVLGEDVGTYVDLREAVVGHELATATIEAHATGLS